MPADDWREYIEQNACTVCGGVDNNPDPERTIITHKLNVVCQHCVDDPYVSHLLRYKEL